MASQVTMDNQGVFYTILESFLFIHKGNTDNPYNITTDL